MKTEAELHRQMWDLLEREGVVRFPTQRRYSQPTGIYWDELQHPY